MAKLERQVLVCYDVASNEARRKLFNALKGVGLVPLQESVFWGFLRRAEERQIGREFQRMLDPATDKAFVIPVVMTPIHAFGYMDGSFDPPPLSMII